MHHIFESRLTELFGLRRISVLRRMLAIRGWIPTTVPDEYKHPDAPGFSIDLEINDPTREGPFVVFQGNRKISRTTYPPYASHLVLRT